MCVCVCVGGVGRWSYVHVCVYNYNVCVCVGGVFVLERKWVCVFTLLGD